MTTRLLPPEEFARLAGTALGDLSASLPATAQVLAVEDDAGALVACWMLLPYWHAEGIWIAPHHRGNAGVVRRVLRGAVALAGTLGITEVITGSDTALVTRLLGKLGARPLPAQFLLPLRSAPEVFPCQE